MWMAWGPDLTMLYNDAYRPTLGIKHPWALGKRASEVWQEIWPDIGPRIETVLEPARPHTKRVCCSFSSGVAFPKKHTTRSRIVPWRTMSGSICGMLCVVTEETERLIGERRVETLRDVAAALAGTNTEDEVLQALKKSSAATRKTCRSRSLTFLTKTAARGSQPQAALRMLILWRRHGSNRGCDFPWPASQIFLRPAHRLD